MEVGLEALEEEIVKVFTDLEVRVIDWYGFEPEAVAPAVRDGFVSWCISEREMLDGVLGGRVRFGFIEWRKLNLNQANF